MGFALGPSVGVQITLWIPSLLECFECWLNDDPITIFPIPQKRHLPKIST